MRYNDLATYLGSFMNRISLALCIHVEWLYSSFSLFLGKLKELLVLKALTGFSHFDKCVLMLLSSFAVFAQSEIFANEAMI